MRILDQLQPQSVFSFFEDLCQIPHGSRNTKAISDYCVRFAKSHSLEYYQDELNNVVIIKPATAGYETAPAVMIQGHLDMVAEKEKDLAFDFTKDALRLAVEGDNVFARGTTLGGDDGIAVAMALAILDADDLPHPRLEAVFTVDEEIGMEGAQGLDVSMLQAKRMLNIDSEDEGILTVSCAGGLRATIRMPIEREDCRLQSCRLTISGLAGGHSGAEIHKERGNANILLGRVLFALSKHTNLRIISCTGGQKDNAIPLLAEAELALDPSEISIAQQLCAWFQETLRGEFAVSDPNVRVSFVCEGEAESACTKESTQKIVSLLSLMPNGIAAMSMDIAGLVQTSCNLGILTTEEAVMVASSSIRSSVASQKQMLLARMEALADMLGAGIRTTGDYPAWEYRRESALRDLMVDVYREQYGSEPKIEAIHAGLECGLFSGKIPGLDAVSFGPDLRDIHTTRETMSISSVQRVWNYLLEILRRMDH